MISQLLMILAGFILLVWGADQFVGAAAKTARKLGVSTLIVGVVIVGLGTSAPEMLVSAIAAVDNHPYLGIGNAIGSNITNLALVLGTTAILAPLTVHSRVLWREFPLLITFTALAYLLLFDGQFARIDGILLLLGLVGLMYWLIHLARTTERSDPFLSEAQAEGESEASNDTSLYRAAITLVISLAVLLLGSRLLVSGASNLATMMGVSDLVIGLSIVAIGTSLPELAATIAAVRKQEDDMAIGNILGSNMFNILGVLGLAGAIAPSAIERTILWRDFPAMFAVTLGVFAIIWHPGEPHRLRRWHGVILVLIFAAYQILLFDAHAS
ncbi:MAG: calcium/sodium antiporter [Pseudomonadota bacterium]|nr:calcium/sodium antiporter [Pseudomonadota bacterium]